MLAVFVVYKKMLIKNLWRSGSDWDQSIDGKSWEKWIGKNVKISLYYFQGSTSVDYDTLELYMLDNGPLCSLVIVMCIPDAAAVVVGASLLQTVVKVPTFTRGQTAVCLVVQTKGFPTSFLALALA